LPAAGAVAQPLGDDDGRAEVVGLFADRLADMESYAQLHAAVLAAVPTTDGLLHRHRATDGAHRARKDDHQAVAEILHLVAAVVLHRVTQQCEVSAPELLGGVVSQPVPLLCGPDDVREEDGDDARSEWRV